MSMNNNGFSLIIEDFEILAKNTSFQTEVKEIRTKHQILAPELKMKYPNGVVKMPQLDREEYGFDTGNLGRKCRLFNTKYRGTFLTMLADYVFTGNISAPFPKLHYAPPAIQIFLENNRPVIKLYLNSDTGIEEIVNVIKSEKKQIYKLQKQSGSKKIKKESPYKNVNIKIWELNKKEGKTEKEIIVMIEKGLIEKPPEDSYSPAGIKRIIQRVENQIQLAFTG